MLHETPQTIYLKDYQPPEYLIDQVDLHFDLGEGETRVHSRLAIRRTPQTPPDRPLYLNGEGLELITLKIDGVALLAGEYRQEREGLTLYRLPEQFTLESEVRIKPQENTALEGLYRSAGMFCTQCEAEGFRKITWYLDRPDVMSRFTTTIVADRQRYPVMLSNGNLVEQQQLVDGRHQVRWEDPFAKPAYLFALVAGDLSLVEDRFTTVSGREVALKIYVEPENVDKCDHAMASLKHAMSWDEIHYGREYDLELYMIVAVNDFNMGAMENKGLNIFNSKYVLARPDTATDQDFQGIEGVIAHEYFHNWTGNRITCRDWFQLSLKEGLTVFRDQEFSADMGSRGVKRIGDVHMLRAHQFAEDASPMAHPIRPDSYIEINNFYTLTVYEKGAEVVRMQHTLLGASDYRKATDLYFQRHDGEAVTTDDFVRCMADASGRDLEQFKRWYSQAGTPELRVSADYDQASRCYTLTVEQSTPATPGQLHKVPLHIPMMVALLDHQGEEVPLQLEGEPAAGETSRLLELRQAVEQFTFVNLAECPVPSLLRGFSAPVKLHFDYSDQELIFLMSRDSDGFNRWDAAQTLSQRIILGRVADPDSPLPEGVIDAFEAALTDQVSDRALLAEVLTLPTEAYLGEQMGVVDVEGIHRAREGLKTELAMALRETLLAQYQAGRGAGAYRQDHAAMARRSLTNLCLDYLMQLDEPEIHRLCVEQYRGADNMTDALAAIGRLADHPGDDSRMLLAEFYDRWKGDPLVLDKWFTLQAVAKRPDALEQVKQLMGHPDFSITNPNRMRSLVGAFCSGNPVRFHGADGAGYAFLADRVLELDPINPQIASRLLRVMARWRRYDELRQGLMKAQLQRIVSVADLSRDVYEIASKCLED